MDLKPLARIPGIGEAFRRLVKDPSATPSQRRKKRSSKPRRWHTSYDARRFKKHVVSRVMSPEELRKKYPPVFTTHHVSDILGLSTRRIQHWIKWGLVNPQLLVKNRLGSFSFLDLVELACVAKIRTCLYGNKPKTPMDVMAATQLPQLRKSIEGVLAKSGDVRDYRFEIDAETNACRLVTRDSALDRRLLRRQIDIGAMWKSLEIMAVKVLIRNKKIESMKTF